VGYVVMLLVASVFRRVVDFSIQIDEEASESC